MSSYCFFIAASWSDGAVSQHFRALAHELVERGHRVVYLLGGKKQVNIKEGALLVRSFPSPRPTKLRDFVFLHKLVRKYQPDCMVANFGAVNVMTIIGWLNRVSCRVDWYHSYGKAFELESNIPEWRRGVLVLRKRLVYRLASHIVAVSNATRGDLLSTYRVDAKKTHIVYNALADPLEQLETTLDTELEPLVTCVGGLFAWKGQDTLIRAASGIRQWLPQVCVDLIGGGPKYEEYKQLIQNNGLEDCCYLIGTLSHRQVLERMRQSWVTVVPSRFDSFPYVVLEALATGTPVIASRVGGIPEAVRDGQDGFLVPPDDPQALAERLHLILSDPSLRARMSENARQRFLDCFELKANVSRQADWFEALVANTKH